MVGAKWVVQSTGRGRGDGQRQCRGGDISPNAMSVYSAKSGAATGHVAARGAPRADDEISDSRVST